MAEESKDRTWQIAGGVLLGLLAFALIDRAFTVWQQRAAVEEFNRQIEAIARPDSDPLGWRAQAREQQQREREAQRRADQARALKPGERCINGQRFRRLPNGWEQLKTPC